MRGAARPAPAVVAASAAARLAAAVRRPRNPAPALDAAAGPCGAAVRALAPPVKKARPSPPGAARPCLFSGAAAPISSPRRCSGAQSGPVGWWPCCAPSAPNGPPVFAPPAGGPFGRSRPVPLALRAEPGAGAVRPAGRPALRRGNLNAARDGRPAQRGEGGPPLGAISGRRKGPRGQQPAHRPAAPLCVALPIVQRGPASRVKPGSQRLPLTPAAERRKAPFA